MLSLIDFLTEFKDNKTCIDYYTKLRFSNGAFCVLCGCKKVWSLKSTGDKQNFKCSSCKRNFNVLVNSFFENTKLPLNKWFVCLYILSTSSKGVSSTQLAKQLGVTQKTAWTMMHKVRNSFPDVDKFFGDIEIDETFVGGKEKNKHYDKKTKGTQGRNTKTKQVIVGSIQRDVYGNKKQVIAKHIPNTKVKTLKKFINQNIDTKANIISDEYAGYNSLSHYKVNHSAKEYVRNNIFHTNNIENFWSIFKRGYIGVYHYMSKKHLQKYVNEYVFRYNNKINLLNIILKNSKKITYKELIRG